MISKMNYLLLSTMMVAAIDSTFGRGCDCCKKLCADKDSNESFPNSENNNTNLEDKLLKDNENTRHINNNDNTHTNFLENSKKKETLYFKIDKTGQDDDIKKCFNGPWSEAYTGEFLPLQQVNENGPNVLMVTGSDNNWKITDPQGKVLGSAGCNPDDNKWIIVKVTTLQEGSKSAGDSFIFYVDEIESVENNGESYGVFDGIKCYSIEIIAANISALGSMNRMFFNVESALEQDWEKNASPGLIGLDKLNVENVTCISLMFYKAIHKQVTLKQLEKWRFGKSSVRVTNLFYSQVKNLNFSVLDGWRNAKKNGTVSFKRAPWSTSEKVFVRSGIKNDFKPPSWYKDIEEAK